MKKLFNKNYLFGLLTGLVLVSGVVYAAYKFNASDIEFKSKNENFKATNVEDALNDLYNSSTSLKAIDVLINSVKNLDKIDGATYKSHDENIVTVNKNGLATAINSGNTIIDVIVNNNVVLKYNVTCSPDLFKVTGGCFYTNNYNPYEYRKCPSDLDNVKTLLTDGISNVQGNFGAVTLHRDGYTYMNFYFGKDVMVSFSSGKCSSGFASLGCGKDAYFYKIDNNGNEELYYTLKQEVNSKSYGAHKFERGNYVVRNKATAVQFDEWNISLVN